jgi:tetratricopeptide (TPR) repeat protein
MASCSDPIWTYCLAFDIACLQALGEDEQAIKVLHAGLLHLWELPECKASTLFLWDRLAYLRYQAKDYPGAIEALERSSSISPRSDGWERALLLSAKHNGSNDLSSRFHELNPDTARGLESTTANRWPKFKMLSESSRNEWVFGLYAVHFVSHSNLAQSTTYQQHAVSAFAKVVEMELRDAVFDRFKQWTLPKKELLEAARTETDPAAKELARFVIGNSPLTLGQMSYALSRSAQLRSVVYREFSSWLRLHMQVLLEQVRNIESLVKMRNEVVHDRGSQDGEQAERLAVVILNSIPSVPARK